MRTFMAKSEAVDRKWFVVDASGEILGRMAVEIAKLLMGKNKPQFTPHVDTGDHVVVVNAEKINFTGKKLTDKLYIHHTGWPGGLRVKNLDRLLKEKPEEVIRLSIRRMLPKNKLGDKMVSKLHIYAGPEHPHAAQMPETVVFGTLKK